MRDFIEIGSSPAGESCAQVGEDNYRENARKEMIAFANQIRRTLGQEPVGAKLIIEWFDHDFGQYGEICCSYDDDIPESEKYAFKCESHSPEFWDIEAKEELGI